MNYVDCRIQGAEIWMIPCPVVQLFVLQPLRRERSLVPVGL